MSIRQQAPDQFRDRLATADKSGRRIWMYPVKPTGELYRARTVVSVFLLAFLFSAPFIKLGEHPLLQFDIIHRQFYIFGIVFWPQDLYLFVLATITFVVFVILFTAVFGRLFCGWICPQTIFMEMVFRKIEQFFEGNGPKQRAFDRRPMDAGKFFRKALKHSLFLGISFLIGNTFLAYIIGADALFGIITDPPSQHVTGLTAMLLFTLVFYWVFAWFREQVCTMVCRYGRLQSVLLDSNSIVVAYDYRRGEKRGPLERGESLDSRGHCIDCEACVRVCPTGIDICNGTQLECINCTACIDACNRVMERMKLPTGLIRYSSERAIKEGRGFRLTGRIAIYSIVLVILLSVMSILMLSRTEVEATILRATGQLYQETDDGTIRNLYSIKLVNKTDRDIRIDLQLKSPAGSITPVGGDMMIPAGELLEAAFFVDINKAQLFTASTLIRIDVVSNTTVLDEITTTFMGPKK